MINKIMITIFSAMISFNVLAVTYGPIIILGPIITLGLMKLQIIR